SRLRAPRPDRGPAGQAPAGRVAPGLSPFHGPRRPESKPPVPHICFSYNQSRDSGGTLDVRTARASALDRACFRPKSIFPVILPVILGLARSEEAARSESGPSLLVVFGHFVPDFGQRLCGLVAR